MTSGYHLRSQGDQDDDSKAYATLPGTSRNAMVQQNYGPLKSQLSPSREVAGCHPSRWIWELLNNAFTTCDVFQRARHANIGGNAWDHPHKLVINGNQSYQVNNHRLLSSVCLDCGFHFVFKMTWDEAHADQRCSPSQATWPPRDDKFPWHHLVWVNSDSNVNIARDKTKYYPLLAREFFACTCAPCTFELHLEISEPRLGLYLPLLLDYDAIREQMKTAREEDPGRYANTPPEWVYQAPTNLNTYLKNLLETAPGESARSISKRNKRFAVLFGPRCYQIFDYLEFKEEVLHKEESDDFIFTPITPNPPDGPLGMTSLGTYRGFIEDCRTEVQCLIHRTANTGSAERPAYCSATLHADLSCQEHLNVSGNDLAHAERYAGLGILPSQTREVIASAYQRQWDLLPTRRRLLVDSLMGVANDIGNESLSEYAITQSSVFDSQTPAQPEHEEESMVPQALAFFGLSPPNNYSPEILIRALRQRISREPAIAGTARQMLLILAQASTNDSYQATLLMESDSKMSSETSRVILGIINETPAFTEVSKQTNQKLTHSKSHDESETYLDAAESLAHHLDSAELQAWCYEQRQLHQIPAGGDISNKSKVVDYNVPVGLHNIGNTCYLNSLLQYLYTVKPVREIVLNYDEVKLDLDDDLIKKRRLGGLKMQMDRGEAVVARAFAEELGILFTNLSSSDQVATRPSQRLANAVLLSTHTLLHAPKVSRAPTPQPPPLPVRPSPAIPDERDKETFENRSSRQSRVDQVEVSSAASDTTLVDVAGSDESNGTYIKVEPSATEVVTVDNDTSMKDAAETQAQVVVADSKDEVNQGHLDATMTDAASEEESIDKKVLTALEHQKRSSGTDQQDVEEVMGSMINRLQAGIRPRSVDKDSGIQLEAILDTFFVTTVNYTKKFSDKHYQSEVSFDRSLTAFPAPTGPCTLYDALGRNFDEQIMDGNISRYTAIRTLPPVLHVLIQRSQSTGGKNNNHVGIPEMLYLDRYKDAPHNSPTFKRRAKDWILGERISDIKSQMARMETLITDMDLLQLTGRQALETKPEQDLMESDKTDAAEPNQNEVEEDNWDFDGEIADEDFDHISRKPEYADPRPKDALPEDANKVPALVKDMMTSELQELEHELAKDLESDMTEPYRLHAVICHRGAMTSGHYWVWIHDFEQHIWRKYNDDDVNENPDTEAVLNQLSSSEEPYFLCYVRDEVKDEFVSVPRRVQPEPVVEPPDTEVKQEVESKEGQGDLKDTEMADEAALIDLEHDPASHDDTHVF